MRGERDVRVEGASEMVEQSESVDTLDERREWNATGMMICRLDSSDMGASRSMSKAKDGSEDGKGTSFICLAHCCKTENARQRVKKIWGPITIYRKSSVQSKPTRRLRACASCP